MNNATHFGLDQRVVFAVLQVPVDDDGEIVDINDQLQLDEKLQIGDSDDQKKKLQHAPDGPLTKALPT